VIAGRNSREVRDLIEVIRQTHQQTMMQVAFATGLAAG
jgi:hypothetical protein